MKKNNGITLIALIINIIVMLILAGVSLNAIVGDNGIITNAQSANIKSGMAALEEWLQEKYVEYYSENENFAKKPELLNDKIRNLLLQDGSRCYIIKDGKVYYLINKTSLPKEIQEILVGGNTTEYSKYIRLQDVYGVTEDLKVYYCDETGNNIYGDMMVANIDPNTPVGKINNDAGLKSALTDKLAEVDVTVNPETGITIGNLESLGNRLELDGSRYNITSLAGLSELRGLVYLTLLNFGSEENSFANLDGLESLTSLQYIYFKNCYISDYSKLENSWDLRYLYMYLPPSMSQAKANDQVTNLGNGLEHANKLEKLENFGISGVVDWIEGTTSSNGLYESSNPDVISLLNDATGLSKISNTIKLKVKYLIFTNTSISNVSFLQGWSGLIKVNFTANKSVTGLTNFGEHSDLTRINFSNCGLIDLSRNRWMFRVNVFRYSIKCEFDIIDWNRRNYFFERNIWLEFKCYHRCICDN